MHAVLYVTVVETNLHEMYGRYRIIQIADLGQVKTHFYCTCAQSHTYTLYIVHIYIFKYNDIYMFSFECIFISMCFGSAHKCVQVYFKTFPLIRTDAYNAYDRLMYVFILQLSFKFVLCCFFFSI